jgi:DNA polymerase V
VRARAYHGPITTDPYGRKLPKHAHGTENLPCSSSSTRQIVEATVSLFDRIVDRSLTVRRITVTANHVLPESEAREAEASVPEQLNLFVDYEAQEREQAAQREELERERQMQKTVIALKKKFGKNAVIKGMNLQEGATAKDRNRQIGGHKA